MNSIHEVEFTKEQIEDIDNIDQNVYAVTISVTDNADSITSRKTPIIFLDNSSIPSLRLQEFLNEELKLPKYYKMGGYANMREDNPWYPSLDSHKISFDLVRRGDNRTTYEKIVFVKYHPDTNEIEYMQSKSTVNKFIQMFNDKLEQKRQLEREREKVEGAFALYKRLTKEEQTEFLKNL